MVKELGTEIGQEKVLEWSAGRPVVKELGTEIGQVRALEADLEAM